MIHEIKMPAAGQTTNKAKITEVYAKIGDTIKRGDILLDAETDKAVLPVESFANGTVLDILVEAGDDVTDGTVLMAIGPAGEKYGRSGATVQTAESATPIPEVFTSVPAAEEDEYLPIIKGTVVPAASVPVSVSHTSYPAMPGAKALAKEKGIDITTIVPSNGQFVKTADVHAYRDPVAAAAPHDMAYEVMPMTRFRAVIGKRMQESMQNIPAWQCTTKINMGTCMAMRDAYKEKRGIKLSYNDILAKAIAIASRKFPLVNARYEGDEVRIYKHTSVGLAVALDGVLVVPVVKDIDVKGLNEISADYTEKVQKARENKLVPTDMDCGSITISNLGMYDVTQFIAIVNPPESCILAVGSILVEPVWDGQTFQPAHIMTVTGSFDHRIIDGAYGAQFLQELKMLMENPSLMLN